jgi:VanZ family protein
MLRLPSPKTLAILWTVLVLLACWTPGDPNPSVRIPGLDKVVHATLFFLESFFLLRVLRRGRSNGRIPCLGTAALSGTLAVLTEVGQLWVPNRAGSVRDLLADALGILLCLAWFRLRRRDSQGKGAHP